MNPNGFTTAKELGRHMQDLHLNSVNSDGSCTYIDVICLQETHLLNTNDVSKNHLGFYGWMHSTRATNDAFGGVSIGYGMGVPSPIDLMAPLWGEFLNFKSIDKLMDYKYPKLEKLKGRLQVAAFQLEDIDIIIANFYGYASSSETQRAELIDMASVVILDCVDCWSGVGFRTNRKISVMWVGDFNANLSSIICCNKGIQNHMLTGKCPRCDSVHKATTRCPTVAIDNLESNGFIHITQLVPGLKDKPYITNVQYSGAANEMKSGIDHVFYLKSLGNRHLHIPRLIFTNESIYGSDAKSYHHLLHISAQHVWNRCVKPNANGCKRAPFKRFPAWVFADLNLLKKIAKCATRYLIKMRKRGAKVHSLFDEFWGIIRDIISEFIKRKKVDLCEMEKQQSNQENLEFADDLTDEQILQDDWEKFNGQSTNSGRFINFDTSLPGCRPIINPQFKVITKPKNVIAETYNMFTRKFEKRLGTDPAQTAREVRRTMRYAPKRISYKQTMDLEKCITIASVIEAIDSMKKEAAPGVDGIPLDLFSAQETKHHLAEMIVLVCNDAMRNGKLPESMRNSVIRLLQKEGKDNADLTAGKRPITLMTLCIRIIAKCLSTAISPYMNLWVGDHQQAYIKGRRIDTNVALLSIILQQAQDNERIDLKRSMLLEVDFKSAFDSIDHAFIEKLLVKIGIGFKIRKIIMLIVGSMRAAVIVNGSLTPYFPIEWGVPQGCSLSGLLFILCLECLNNQILAKPQIYGKGLALECNAKHRVITAVYADDVNAFLSGVRYLRSWITLLQRFHIPSGLEVNWKKTRINLIGWWYKECSSQDRNRRAQLTHRVINRLRTDVIAEYPEVEISVRKDVTAVGVIMSIDHYLTSVSVPEYDLTTKSWQKVIENVTPVANAVAFKLQDEYITLKKFHVSRIMSLFTYTAMTCPINSKISSSLRAVIDRVLWGFGHPAKFLVPYRRYYADVKVIGSLPFLDPVLQVNAMNAQWVRLFVINSLPKNLSDFYYRILKSCIQFLTGRNGVTKSIGIGDTEEHVDLVNLFVSTYRKASSGRRNNLLLQKCKPNAKGEKWYKPFIQACITMASLSEVHIPKTFEDWKHSSTKKVYKFILLNQPKVSAIFSGPQRWLTGANYIDLKLSPDVVFEQLWKVAIGFRSSYPEIFHALYYVISHRFVVPRNNGCNEEKYDICKYCTRNDVSSSQRWDPVHALFDCPHRSKCIWTKSWSRHIRELSVKNVLLECQNIEVNADGVYVPTPMQILTLVTLSVLVEWVMLHRHEISTENSGPDNQEHRGRVRLLTNHSVDQFTNVCYRLIQSRAVSIDERVKAGIG
jgi:hypothetical protein